MPCVSQGLCSTPPSPPHTHQQLTTREHEFADALLVSVEGINHFMLFGTRELVTHGTSSPQFTAQEAAHLADTCNVVPGHASNRQVLCALRDTTMPILKALLADAPAAAVHAIDEYRQSAVHIAARYGDAAAIAALVAAGAPVNTATVDLKQSPLHRAVMAGWAAAVAALLDAGKSGGGGGGDPLLHRHLASIVHPNRPLCRLPPPPFNLSRRGCCSQGLVWAHSY